MHKLSENFYFALVSFLLQAKQEVAGISGEFGLTSIQALTLLMLDTSDKHSMSSFCKMYDCDASNITGIIDGLEQKKLVSRRAHPSDRRIKIVHLESAGQKMQRKIIKRFAETSGHLFAGLTEAEANQFANLVQKLNSPKITTN